MKFLSSSWPSRIYQKHRQRIAWLRQVLQLYFEQLQAIQTTLISSKIYFYNPQQLIMDEQYFFDSVPMKEQQYLHCRISFIQVQQEPKEENNSNAKIQNIIRAVELNSNNPVKRPQKNKQTISKDRLSAQKAKLLETSALLMIIQDAYPAMVEQSIQYLFKLSRFWSQEKIIQQRFTLESIRNYFFSFYGNGFEKFYELSLTILINRIQQLIKQYQQGMRADSLNIRIEIFAHYIKNIVEFQEYLPKKKKTEYLKPHYLMRALNIHKESYSSLKSFYTEAKREQITFFDDQMLNISVLINTYYILQLRKKCQGLSQIFKELAFSINETPNVFLKEKINHLKNCKQQNINIQSKRSGRIRGTSRTFSEEFALINKKQKVKYSTLSLQEIEQEVAIFKELFSNRPRQIKNHEQIRYLAAKYHKSKDSYYTKFRSYKLKMKQYGDNNIDQIKDRYIINRLLQDVNVPYEKICKGAYQSACIYISKTYFDENINGLLRKQCRNQQMSYLKQIISLIQAQQDKKEIIFLQKYLLPGQSDKSQSDKVVFFVAISARGINYSKAINNSSNFERAYFYQMMNKMEKSSIIISNDPTLQLEGYFNGRMFNINKTVYVLPCLKASLFPNPCQIIYHMVFQCLKILITSNQDKASLKILVQALLERIICEFGSDIVTVELDLSALVVDSSKSKEQISDLKKAINQLLLYRKLIKDTDNMLILDTQELRRYLHTIKLYSLRLISIQAKQMKM